MPIRVNGQEIPEAAVRYELERLIKFYSQHMGADQIREQMDTLKKKAREQAIGAKLLIDEAERLDLEVPESEVDKHYRQMVETVGGQEKFRAIMVRQRLSEEGLKAGIRRGRRVDKLIEKITAGVPEPTEEQMERHFKEHAAEYSKPDRAQAQHILVKVDEDRDAERAAAQEKLREIRKSVRAGADFAGQAAAHSECPSGQKTGGSLGWFSRGMLVPELDEAIFSMEVGALSDVIETPLGWHLVYKIGHETGGPASYDDVREKIRDFLRHVRRGEAIAAHVRELKRKAVIEE
jgi:nitrogen fixation protein NifM